MRAFWKSLTIASLAAAGVLLGGCLAGSDAPPPILVGENLSGEFVAPLANHPAAVAFAGDGRVFYVEKNTGQIRVIVDGQLQDTPFAVLPVNFAEERGALGIALHPDFADNGRVFVFYSLSDTGGPTDDPVAIVDNRVVYFEAEGNLAVGGEIFVTALPTGLAARRVGGRIAFDSDSKLLIGLGDQGDDAAAADNTVLLGKILRLNDDGSIPDDNPTAGSPVLARGVREPRGLALDPLDGALFVLDRNSTSAGSEEITRVRPGANLGWPSVVGTADTTAELEFAAANSDYVDPLFDSGTARLGLDGLTFNPSTRYGQQKQNSLLVGRGVGQRVIELRLDALRTGVAEQLDFAQNLRDLVSDVACTPAGTLYVATTANVFRIVPIR